MIAKLQNLEQIRDAWVVELSRCTKPKAIEHAQKEVAAWTAKIEACKFCK